MSSTSTSIQSLVEQSKKISELLWQVEEKLSKFELKSDDIFVVVRSSQINNNNIDSALPFKVIDFDGNSINVADRVEKVIFFKRKKRQ